MSKEIPAVIKKNVRSVLLSKQGGVLVSDFLKDYKKLIERPLHFKELGYDNILEFIKGLADAEVARLEYCDELMAYKIYGMGDPNMYMSLSAKRAQGSKKAPFKVEPAPTDDQDEELNMQEDLLAPNSRGLYSLVYPKKAEPKGVTEGDVIDRFKGIGDVVEVSIIPRYIFIRFREKKLALKALNTYGAELELRVADDKTNKSKIPPQAKTSNPKQKTEKSASKDKSGDIIEIYFGNIQHTVTEEDFEELVSEFSPKVCRLHRVKSDAKKLFAFVDVTSRDTGDRLIEKFDQYHWKGRKLNVRYAKDTPPPKKSESESYDKRRNKRDQISDKPKPGWREKTDNSKRGAETKSEDEEEWGMEEDSAQKSNLSEKMSELNINTQQNQVVEQPPHSKSLSPSSHSYNQLVQQTHAATPPQQTQQHSSKTYFNSTYNNNSPKNSPEVTPSGDADRTQQYTPQQNRGARTPQDTHTAQQNSIQINQPRKTLLSTPTENRNHNGYASSPKEMAPEEPEDDDEMPGLEPLDDMPSLEYIDRPAILYVGNFLYGNREEDIANLFAPYNVVDVNIRNTHNKMKSSYALVTVGSMNDAQQAMADLDQRFHQQRRLLVCLAKQDPCYETPAVFSSPVEVRNIRCTIGPGGDSHRSVSIRKAGSDNGGGYAAGRSPGSKSDSHSSLDTIGSDTSIVKKSFSSLLLTYQIIMKKLGGGRRDMRLKSGDTVTVFITSIFDSKNFWAQIVEDEDSLQNLEYILTMLQERDCRIGPTRGLGRCAALHDNDWFRGWIIAERKNFTVDVFFVDYGNTACCPKQTTSLTVPEIWEHKPVVRPFCIPDDINFSLTPEMESRLAILTVRRTGIDETGLLTEVVITDMPAAE